MLLSHLGFEADKLVGLYDSVLVTQKPLKSSYAGVLRSPSTVFRGGFGEGGD